MEEIEQQPQAARLIWVNGQAVILTGDTSESAINEISPDLLQQAIQQAAAVTPEAAGEEEGAVESGDTVVGEMEGVEERIGEGEDPYSGVTADNVENFVAILHGEHGETHTIHLTPEQVEALGFQVGEAVEVEVQGAMEGTTEVDKTPQQNETQQEEEGPMEEERSAQVEGPPTEEDTPQVDATPQTEDPELKEEGKGATEDEEEVQRSPLELPNDQHESSAAAVAAVTDILAEITAAATEGSGTSGGAENQPITRLSEYPEEDPVTFTLNLSDTRMVTNGRSVLRPKFTFSPAPMAASINSRAAIASNNGSGAIGGKQGNVTDRQEAKGHSGGLGGRERTPTVLVRSILIGAKEGTGTLTKVTPSFSAATIAQGQKTTITQVAPGSTQPRVSLTVAPAPAITTSQVLPGSILARPNATAAVVVPANGERESGSGLNLPSSGANSGRPLGSSENPIQLIQQGSTFHSMQALSPEQVRQIATVLQQRQTGSQAPATQNIVFDSETNTRVIYRVVYPEDLNLQKPQGQPPAVELGANSTPTRQQVTVRRKRGRPPKSVVLASRKAREEAEPEEDRYSGPELSKEEKEERKKQLLRTRSGRLSRPPRYMVRDYKRLHHLDFSGTEIDDSDGGYSDYQISAGEAEEEEDPKPVPPVVGLDMCRRRLAPPYHCPKCHKLYLGKQRMVQHFDMFPDHGSEADLTTARHTASELSPVQEPQDEDESTLERIPQNHGEGLLKTRAASSTSSGVAKPLSNGIIPRKKKRRGRYAYVTPEEKSNRRKEKLQEVLQQCTLQESLDVMGPQLGQALSLADFLCLRCKHGHPNLPPLVATHKELQVLLPSLRALGSQQQQEQARNANHNGLITLTLEDQTLASLLGLPVGVYQVASPKPKADAFSQSTVYCQKEPQEEEHEQEARDLRKKPRLEQSRPTNLEAEIADALTQLPQAQAYGVDRNSHNGTEAALGMLLVSGNAATTNGDDGTTAGAADVSSSEGSASDSQLTLYLEPDSSTDTEMMLDPETGKFVPVEDTAADPSIDIKALVDGQGEGQMDKFN